MSAEQRAAIESMKRSIQILRAVARNCSDLEAADDVAREAALLATKIAALEGTPQANSAEAQKRAA